MKRIRRSIAFCLAVLLILGLFAGCQTAPERTTETTESVRDDLHAGLNPSQGESGKNLHPLTVRSEGSNPVKDYTVLVYMVGSNLESQGGYASEDILEMLDSGLSCENNNLLVYTGGATSWSLNIRSDVNTVYALNTSGDTMEEVAVTGQPVNMGDPQTLLDFLNYATTYYPAEKYGLICWDHGGGPLFGFGSDELFEHDGLGVWELQAALEAASFGDQKLGFIGFDACLMASLEVAAILAPYAEYLVASEEVEPGNGWDYSFLQTLNTTDDTLTLAQSILDTYRTAMEADFWRPEYTLSCVDLNRVFDVIGSMDGVWRQMVSELSDGNFSNIARSRNETKRFGVSAVSDRGSSYDLVDLGDMIAKLGEGYSDLADTVRQALELAVVRQVTNVEEATGLSLYYPYDNKNLYQDGGYLFEFTELQDNYGSFMELFTQLWLTAGGDLRLRDTQTVQIEEDVLTLQLEEDQLADLGSVTYTVLQYDADTESYSGILYGFETTPDQAGVIRIPRNPEVFVLHTDTEDPGEEGILWSVTLVESGLTKNSYITNGTCLFSSVDVIVGGTEPIQIALADDFRAGEVVIQSILSQSWADSEFYGRQNVSIDNWGILAYNVDPRYPTYDIEGRLLPSEEWESDGSFWYVLGNYEETFRFEKVDLQSMEGDFYCQVVMKDTAGHVIGTRLVELYSSDASEEKMIHIPEGTLIFRIYEDHAVLTEFAAIEPEDLYAHADYTVTVPSYVDGVPVTVIGNNAFRACTDIQKVILPETLVEIEYGAFASAYYLQEVNLPEGLKVIGNQAFAYCNLAELVLPESLEQLGYQSFAGNEITEITIPAGVNLVGAGSFAYCDELTAIHVAAENGTYKSLEGVLFSADGKTLVAYPAAKGERYDIPAGVEIVGDEAFRGNGTLTTLNFPEGLRVIDRLAFCDAKSLLYIKLPRSLEAIGNAAFGDSDYSAPTVTIPVLQIGPNVNWIGYDAFLGYDIQAFEVNGENAFYSSANGCLLNASGTRMIQAPTAREGVLEVPEGVSYIAWSAFDSCDLITELILPDSLVAMNHAAGVPSGLRKVVIGKGMMDWQNVTSFYTVPVIEIHPENPNYTMTPDGSIYTRDMSKLLLCRDESEEVVIPEGVTAIGVGAMRSMYGDAATMKRLVLPSTLTKIPDNAFSNLTALESFRVAEGNPAFAAWDGLLYTADGKTLIACPVGITGTVEVREGTVEIGAYAFYSSYRKVSVVVIPEGVTTMRFGNFTSTLYNSQLALYLPASLTEIHVDTFSYAQPENVTVYCPAGSAAETQARQYGLTVVHN